LVFGEKQTGVTLHYMIAKPDAGDIVGQKIIDIDYADTARTLYDKMCQTAESLLDSLLPGMKNGQIPRRRQDLAAGSYYGGRKPEDGRIDWNKPAVEIYNLIRAVTEPYPGAFGLMENNEKILIWWAEPLPSGSKEIPGTLNYIREEVLVQTGENAIKIMDIEVQGKRLRGAQIGKYLRDAKVIRIK
jgi:methionyl-tRNA formyltransferase